LASLHMAQHPFIASNKTLISVRNGIERIKSGIFTENDVRELMLDLREASTYISNQLSKETNEFTALIKIFIDVCDFIVHPDRDDGVIEENVRRHVRKLHAAVESSTVEDFINIPVEGVLNANKVVLGMAGIAYFLLSSVDKSLSTDYFISLQDHQAEVALCIMSILQGMTIDLRENEGSAALQLYPYGGIYRVYCQIINSRIEREARDRTGGAGRVFLGFPIMISTVSSSDASEPDFLYETTPFPIFETYRENGRELKLRVLQDFGGFSDILKEADEIPFIAYKKLSMQCKALTRVYEGVFNESDIKIILIGLRDHINLISNKVRNIQNAPKGIKFGLPYLVDIAHSIAHPGVRTQGPIRNYIKNIDKEMAKSLKKMSHQKVLSIDAETKIVNIALPPSIKTLSAYELTISFLSFLPDLFPFNLDTKKLAEQGSDIELCLLSILNYMQFPLLDETREQRPPHDVRHGYLAFHTWNGMHHIYAGVSNSLYGQALGRESRKEKMDKPFINILPVFNSSRPVADGLVFDARNPMVLVAERNISGKLNLIVRK